MQNLSDPEKCKLALVNLIRALIPDQKEADKAIVDAFENLAKNFTRPQDFEPKPMTDEAKEGARQLQAILKGDPDTAKAVSTIVVAIIALMFSIEPIRSFIAIDYYLRVLLGDSYFSHLPKTIDEMLKAHGVDKPAADITSLEE